MVDYIKSILPRIQRYSKQLNEEANFVEIPWGFLDTNGHKVTYIFRRSGELLVSKQGEVATGRWEYLPAMQSMLIEHEGSKRMYNQGFLDNVVMILRKDGTEELLPLINTQVNSDFDLLNYLKTKTDQLSNTDTLIEVSGQDARPFLERELPDGEGKIIILGNPGQSGVSLTAGKIVLDGETHNPLRDGKVELSEGEYIIVKDGKISRYFSLSALLKDIITIGIVFIIILLLALYLSSSF